MRRRRLALLVFIVFPLTLLTQYLFMQYLFPVIMESDLLFAILVITLFVAGVVLTTIAYQIGMRGGRR